MPDIETNGYFGTVQGPFAADEDVFEKIQQQCKYNVNYLLKVGIHMPGTFDFDIFGEQENPIFVDINGESFQMGATRILEFEDVRITSIKFPAGAGDEVYVDYYYRKTVEEDI